MCRLEDEVWIKMNIESSLDGEGQGGRAVDMFKGTDGKAE